MELLVPSTSIITGVGNWLAEIVNCVTDHHGPWFEGLLGAT
jgi:hypothetical protein